MVQCVLSITMLQKVREPAHAGTSARLHDKVGEGHDLSAMFSEEEMI